MAVEMIERLNAAHVSESSPVTRQRFSTAIVMS
jgi:hypothetical protein